jgi:hypothetical protein
VAEEGHCVPRGILVVVSSVRVRRLRREVFPCSFSWPVHDYYLYGGGSARHRLHRPGHFDRCRPDHFRSSMARRRTQHGHCIRRLHIPELCVGSEVQKRF